MGTDIGITRRASTRRIRLNGDALMERSCPRWPAARRMGVIRVTGIQVTDIQVDLPPQVTRETGIPVMVIRTGGIITTDTPVVIIRRQASFRGHRSHHD